VCLIHFFEKINTHVKKNDHIIILLTNWWIMKFLGNLNSLLVADIHNTPNLWFALHICFRTFHARRFATGTNNCLQLFFSLFLFFLHFWGILESFFFFFAKRKQIYIMHQSSLPDNLFIRELIFKIELNLNWCKKI